MQVFDSFQTLAAGTGQNIPNVASGGITVNTHSYWEGAPTETQNANNTDNSFLKPLSPDMCHSYQIQKGYQVIAQGVEGPNVQKGAQLGDVSTKDGKEWFVRYQGKEFKTNSPQQAQESIDQIESQTMVQGTDSKIQKLLEKAYVDMRHNKLGEWEQQNLMQVIGSCRASGTKMSNDLRQALLKAAQTAVNAKAAKSTTPVQALQRCE